MPIWKQIGKRECLYENIEVAGKVKLLHLGYCVVKGSRKPDFSKDEIDDMIEGKLGELQSESEKIRPFLLGEKEIEDAPKQIREYVNTRNRRLEQVSDMENEIIRLKKDMRDIESECLREVIGKSPEKDGKYHIDGRLTKYPAFYCMLRTLPKYKEELELHKQVGDIMRSVDELDEKYMPTPMD